MHLNCICNEIETECPYCQSERSDFLAKDTQSRKWQLTVNNPKDKELTHDEIKKRLNSLSSLEYACMADEVGKQETHHTHVYVFYKNPKKFNTIKKLFPEAHIELARGSHIANRDYVFKEGKWADKKDKGINFPETHEEIGEIPSENTYVPEKEADIFAQIQEYIDSGMTPREIMLQNVAYVKYEHQIKRFYFMKCCEETPPIREVTIFYHVGASGSGKSYTYVQLCEKYGENNVYLVTDYANNATASFDGYNAEKCIFLDEVKNNIPYSLFLLLTDRYKADIHCRYSNTVSLWNEVHITSIYPIEELYKNMVPEEKRQRDSIRQLLRRISYMVYHFKKTDENGNEEYNSYKIPMKAYLDYEDLKNYANLTYKAKKNPIVLPDVNNQSEKNNTIDIEFED